MKQSTNWKFFRAGGFDQVKLESGKHLANLDQLDQKLWVALACPTTGLEIDSRTLALIDADKDGRVRAPELVAAVKFACAHLKNPDELLESKKELALSAIDDTSDAGKTLVASARQVLTNIGKKDDDVISADDLADPKRIFAGTPFNGDGVITELSTSDEFTRGVIRDIVECMGGVDDRSGQLGVNEENVDAFFKEAKAYTDWLAAAKADPNVFPLERSKTEAAAASLAAVRAKADDYFARCRLATFDRRIAQMLNRKEEEYVEVAARDLSLTASEVAGFPLAQVGPEHSLPLLAGINPAHAPAMATLREVAVLPLLGNRDVLTETDWLTLNHKLAPYEQWLANKQGLRIEKLGEPRILEIGSSNLNDELRVLIAKDKALEAEAASIDNVEKLVRYYRDLYLICTNFVNFQDFYDGCDPASFQCGTLYLDQRTCKLCLRVEDPAKHAAMAALAGAYLAYADCTRSATGEKMHIVAAFTAGDSDNLMVGRNGLFYDRQGRDWDATITKIIDNPISLRQAFWAPYKKLVRMIEEQVAKRAAAANADTHTSLSSAASTVANADKTAPATGATAAKPIDVGSVAALGVAVGALGAFLTAIVGYATGILKLGVLATVAAIIGVMLLISLPSVVLAYITLRKRNLGPILDANGWAINASAKINVAFGTSLTELAKLPPGSRRDTRDRFADKGPPWKRLVFVLILGLLAYRWYEGSFNRFLPEQFQSTRVLGKFAPCAPPATSASPSRQ